MSTDTHPVMPRERLDRIRALSLMPLESPFDDDKISELVEATPELLNEIERMQEFTRTHGPGRVKSTGDKHDSSVWEPIS